MAKSDRPTVPPVPTYATPRAVVSAAVARRTLRCLTGAIPTNQPGVWFALTQVGGIEILSADARYLGAAAFVADVDGGERSHKLDAVS